MIRNFSRKRKRIKLVRRLLGIAVLVFGVTFLAFSLMYLASGDPAKTILRAGGNMPTEEQILQKREEMGLNRPLLVQYGSWLKGLTRGEFGVSMIDGRNATKELLSGLWASALLAVISLLGAMAVAFPAGVYAAVRKNRMFDRITLFLVFIRLSAPSFLVGLALLYVFAYRLKLVSIVASNSGMAGIVLPALTLATGICARMIRQIRTMVNRELSAEYVEGARARGVLERKILFSHVLKNCMLPIITLIALSFGSLLGGTAVTEIIFSWPGIGRMVIDAIGARDYAIIQGFVVLTSLIFCILYGLTEAVYRLFDPRLRDAGE